MTDSDLNKRVVGKLGVGERDTTMQYQGNVVKYNEIERENTWSELMRTDGVRAAIRCCDRVKERGWEGVRKMDGLKGLNRDVKKEKSIGGQQKSLKLGTPTTHKRAHSFHSPPLFPQIQDYGLQSFYLRFV